MNYDFKIVCNLTLFKLGNGVHDKCVDLITRYSDGDLTMIIKNGDKCRSNFRRETIIDFYCNKTAGWCSRVFQFSLHQNRKFDFNRENNNPFNFAVNLNNLRLFIFNLNILHVARITGQ